MTKGRATKKTTAKADPRLGVILLAEKGTTVKSAYQPRQPLEPGENMAYLHRNSEGVVEALRTNLSRGEPFGKNGGGEREGTL